MHHRLLAVLFAGLLGAPAVAVAQERATPRREVPGLDFRPDGVWRKQAAAVRAARARLFSQGRFSELNAPLAAGASAPSAAAVSGTLSVPAVLFTYAGTSAPPFATSDYDAVFFGTTPQLGRPYTYHSFYSQMSNGLLDIQGSTWGWVTLSKPEVGYTGDTSSQCRQVNPFSSANCNGVWSNTAFTALQGALREALAHADSQIDFTKFSFDPATGVVSLVVFIHPTVGGECGPQGSPQNHLWAHRASLFPGYMTKDAWPGHSGQFLQVEDYVLQSGLGGGTSCDATQIMPIGTVAHETGHAFGLPDLYDTGGSTEGVGRWSLMGAGNFSSPSSPARMDAWSLSQLGWVTLAPLTATGSYSFGAAPSSDTAFVVRPTGSNPRGEYFVLDNRQAVDADTALIRNACQVWYQNATPPQCGGGLLIWHVDSQQIANHGFRLGNNAVNVGPVHGLELMQADARANLDANPATTCIPPAQGCADRGDAGDPYPGILGNQTFSLTTTPNSALNGGGCPGFGIDTITQVVPNGAMRFFLRIGGDTLTVTTTSPLVAAQWGYSYAAAFTAACGAGAYTWAQPDSGALPLGVALSSSGALSGAPTDTGTYTFRTSVTDGSKTARRTLTLQVVEPALTLKQALNVGFQGPAPASDDQRRYLDLQGNRNGTFDLGDLLRWLSRTGNLSAPAPSTRVSGTGRRP